MLFSQVGLPARLEGVVFILLKISTSGIRTKAVAKLFKGPHGSDGTERIRGYKSNQPSLRPFIEL